MPCIEMKVNIPVTEEKERAVKTELGKSIAILPGKSEQWLMVTVEPETTIYFQGKKDSPLAFVAVSIYGKAAGGEYDRLTGEICRICQEILGIRPENVYVKYEEIQYWGWNGRNF